MREERNTNNDLISRKWLTDAIRNRRTYLSYEDAKDVIDLIDNAPAVEAFTENDKALAYCEGYVRGSHEAYIRLQGEWEKCQNDMFRCSKCRQADEVPTAMGAPIYNFCPNCGAYMQKGGAE